MPRCLAVLPVFVVIAIVAACSDTPRGVQGIDFYVEGGMSDDAGTADVGDVQGLCQETPDPTGFCAQLGGAGTLYTHLIVCIDGAQPVLLDCDSPDAAPDGGAQSFCCTTGLL
jgi:hypothetical protein